MRHYLRLILITLLWGVLFALLGLNLYYGTTLFYFFELIPEWQPPHFQALATLLVGLVGGAGALITFIYNYRQRQHQHQLDILEKRFADIQDRFAEQDPRMRANAAIRLAEMAEQPEPGKPADKRLQHYPFFARAAAQLSAALHMEDDPRVRDEMKKALKRMTEFAKNSPKQNLLRRLIDELADANRSAAKAFYRALGEYLALYEDSKHAVALKRAALVVGLLSENNDDYRETSRILGLLTREQAVQDAQHSARLLWTGRITRQDRQGALKELDKSADRLRDTRDALETAIRGWKRTRAKPPLNLSGCALMGASLNNAQLRGVILEMARLQGAVLANADLHRANLSCAQMQETILTGADLTRAVLFGTQLQEAAWLEVKLQRANMEGAKLQKAILWGAQFSRAQLRGADLSKADLTLADLRGAITDETTIIPYNPERTRGCIYDKTGAFANWPDPPTPEQYEQWKQMPLEEFLKQFETPAQGSDDAPSPPPSTP